LPAASNLISKNWITKPPLSSNNSCNPSKLIFQLAPPHLHRAKYTPQLSQLHPTT
jgi:hypothetical protein